MDTWMVMMVRKKVGMDQSCTVTKENQMQVLFLDFDGVLNSKQHFMMIKNDKPAYNEDKELSDYLTMKQQTNVNNMWVLGYILKQLPDLKIVISSAWGKFYGLDQFKRLFKHYKLDPERLIGITPRKMSSYRCNEIHWWLEGAVEEFKPTSMRWIALDDHEIFRLDEDDINNQHLTDSWVGVTMNDAFKIIKHFDPKFKEPWFGI